MRYPLIILTLSLFLCCSRWIAPPFTDVEKISNIRTGMTLNEVNKELGIEPYDVYFNGEDECLVVYNYRVKERVMDVSDNDNTYIHKDISQYKGKEKYGDNYLCLVYFQNNIVSSVFTKKGKKIKY